MAKGMEVQAPTSTTTDYLLMMDAKTTDCEELTSLVQESKYFTRLPIKIKIQELYLTKDQHRLDWNDPDRLEVVTILGSGHLVKTTINAWKNNFNSKGSKDLCNCPGGTSAKFSIWYADRDSPNPDKDQKHHADCTYYFKYSTPSEPPR